MSVAKRTTRSKKTAKKRTTKKSASARSASAPKRPGRAGTASAAQTTEKKTAKKTAGKSATRKSPARAADKSKRVTRAAKKAPRRASASRKQAAGKGAKTEYEAPPKVIRTRLKDTELAEFRELLVAKRRELAGDVLHLENEARDHNSNGGNSSPMPLHMADLGTDTWEQELTLGLIEAERSLLREIDEALERIEDRTYGVCLGTGKPIAKARLRVKPWAKYCIEYARKRELGLV